MTSYIGNGAGGGNGGGNGGDDGVSYFAFRVFAFSVFLQRLRYRPQFFPFPLSPARWFPLGLHDNATD